MEHLKTLQLYCCPSLKHFFSDFPTVTTTRSENTLLQQIVELAQMCHKIYKFAYKCDNLKQNMGNFLSAGFLPTNIPSSNEITFGHHGLNARFSNKNCISSLDFYLLSNV